MRNTLFTTVLILVLTTIFFAGCKQEPQESLFNPKYVSGPAPVITAVAPDSAFGGIGEVTITGENFIADVQKNWVYFDKEQATILNASTTELKVIAPSVVSDTAKLKVSVFGSDQFSNILQYKLMAAVENMTDFKPAEAPQKMTCDNDGNIYFTMLSDVISGTLADSVYMFNYLTKERKGFAVAKKQYDAMRIGPTKQLYALHGTRKHMYVYPVGGGEPERHSIKKKVFDFDFDADQNIWAAGKEGDGIIEVNISDWSVSYFDYSGAVSAVKVYNGDLYLATKTDTTHIIYKRKIVSADSLAPAEVYFDLAQVFDMTSIGDDKVVGMSFSQDGHLYLSCQDDANAANAPALVVVTPGGASFEAVYPVLFSDERKNSSLTWGVFGGTNLFISRSATYSSTGEVTSPAVLLRVNTLRVGAPEYGRGDQ